MKYRILKKKTFETHDKFEKRINEETITGWKVNSMANDNHQLVVLLERESKL